MSLLTDGRLRTVQWKDLTRLSPMEMIIENSITIPWLLISCLLAACHYYIPALPLQPPASPRTLSAERRCRRQLGQHVVALRSKDRPVIVLELAARIRKALPDKTFKEVF